MNKASSEILNTQAAFMITGKPEWWDSAVVFLLEDEILGPVVKKYENEHLTGKGDIFSTFVRSVVGQQISVIAADSIWNRLSNLVGEMSPENICKFSPDELATSGITRPKSQYIHGVATNSVDFLSAKWNDLSDAEINKHLTKFRGIGPWTSEMVMIFALLRPDIFSIGDIGLIKGVQMLVPDAVSKADVLDVSKRWAPYRTAASWYLWRMLDPVPVEY